MFWSGITESTEVVINVRDCLEEERENEGIQELFGEEFKRVQSNSLDLVGFGTVDSNEDKTEFEVDFEDVEENGAFRLE